MNLRSCTRFSIALPTALLCGVGSTALSQLSSAQCLEDKLHAPIPAPQTAYGLALSLERDVLLVGEDAGNTAGPQTGSVYAYRRHAASGRWFFDQLLVAGDPQPGSEFGRALAISGDYVFVGARLHSVVTTGTGAAYVFRRDAATNSWQQIQRLANPVGNVFDNFGVSIAAHGDALLVAAPQTDLSAPNSGSVFAYRRNPATGAYDFEQEISASDGSLGARFGVRVDVHDDSAVSGALLDGQAGYHAGSTYVFRRNAQTSRWDEYQKLIPSDVEPEDRFGTDVAIGDGVLAASSVLDDDGGLNAGAVYLYRLDPASGLWLEWQKLVAPDAAPGDAFGITLRLADDLLLVGAPQDDDDGDGSGSAYLYREDPSTHLWHLDRKLTAGDASAGDNYGRGLAIGDGMVAVGAYLDDVGVLNSGAAYVHLLDYDDCNANGQPDTCDVDAGTSSDTNANFVPDECETAGTPYCLPAVPNSTTYPADLTAFGIPTAAAGHLTLLATDLPPGQYVLFLTGTQQAFLPGHAGSQGNLCIAPPHTRFAADLERSNSNGALSIEVDTTALPTTPPSAVQPGETWNYQAWYRDAGTSNFTNGVSVVFQ